MALIEKPKGEPFDNGPKGPDGQYGKYAVLPTGERKAFIRPLRRSYKHVGLRPENVLRDLTPEEHERYDQYKYVAYEAYPPDGSSVTGRFWTKEQLGSGCGTVTTMGLALCETYAADPTYYGSTFCSGCGSHLPVAEFTWTEDGARVGS